MLEMTSDIPTNAAGKRVKSNIACERNKQYVKDLFL